METKKQKIISIVATIGVILTLVGATYAYFQAQVGEGKSTDVNINASTVDVFTFATGDSISFSLDQENFAEGKGNKTASTYASAMLSANNKTNTATENYNMYLNINTNNFSYTESSSSPEIILSIISSDGEEIKTISGLDYVTVNSVSGFDITTYTGIINLLQDRSISTTSTTTEKWIITITYHNYDFDQSLNAGKNLNAQVIITSDDYSNYTPATISSLSATQNGSNLKVDINLNEGDSEIDNYYYSIQESNYLAYNEIGIYKLSNVMAANEVEYFETSESSYTFTNVDTSKRYIVSVYGVDKNKIRTNTYNHNIYETSMSLPVINDVSTSSSGSDLTVSVTVTKGTNNISKYYYSIDGGSTFNESSESTYTFNDVKEGNNVIVIKILDSKGNYSNEFYKIISFNNPYSGLISFTIDGTQYYATSGMTWSEWVSSEYNTGGFYIGQFMGVSVVLKRSNERYITPSYKDGEYVSPSESIIEDHKYYTNNAPIT